MANTTKEPKTKAENTTEETKAEAPETPAKDKPKKERKEAKTFTVTVKNNFTGVGAGGVAFANGKAVGVNARMAEWFRNHEGYTVKPE